MKKTLAILLAMALLCMMVVGTTLTYFTDEDGDVNTMAVGNVGITQNETDRNGTALDTDSLKLYPVTADPDTDGLVPIANNGVDKIVTVENTGSEAAYVRTVFAFEMMAIKNGEGQITGWDNPVDREVRYVAGTAIDFSEDLKIYKYSNNTYGISETGATAAYVIGVCTYPDALTAPVGNGKSVSAPSLKQVYLDRSVGNEFSPSVGGSYEILVVSQAVQAQGFGDNANAAFTAAFPYGENNKNVADWFNNLNQ